MAMMIEAWLISSKKREYPYQGKSISGKQVI
jgi:hypothetical protein